MTYTLRWGILASGWISNKFVLDLLIDPATRQVSDVKHKVVAVGSRSIDSAKSFVERTWEEAGTTEGKEDVKTYGSYEELVRDPNVDCIYVGSPHSHHYPHVALALNAGKPVLSEKAFVVNEPQLQALVKLAREKDLFLMEAVWTRFQPYAYKVQEVLASGIIGEVRGLKSELSVDFTKTVAADPAHRLYNPDLAGGALLDLGPYSYVHSALVLRPNTSASTEPLPVPKITATCIKTPSGVDQSTVAVLEHKTETGRTVHATLICAQDRQTREPCVVVQGSKGYLEVHAPTYRPKGLTYYAWESEEDFGDLETQPAKTETFQFEPRPGGIWGFAWEADEVARCIRDGKKESDRMPLRESILTMQIFDEIRRQSDFRLPEAIETLDLPSSSA
ncbi:hypothetical protein JCM6882_003861 [Rhodosporidiobolus microsporus]